MCKKLKHIILLILYNFKGEIFLCNTYIRTIEKGIKGGGWIINELIDSIEGEKLLYQILPNSFTLIFCKRLESLKCDWLLIIQPFTPKGY